MASTSSMPANSDHYSNAIRTLTCFLLTIGVIVVVLRVYVRLYIGKNFGLDDAFIVLTLALLIVGDVCIFKMIADGIGRPLASFSNPVEEATQVVKWNTIYQLSTLWKPEGRGRCISADIPRKVSYAQSAFAILSDLFLTASPIVILWNIKITLKQRIAICGLMSLGLMATIENAMRTVYIPNLTKSDLTYTIAPIVIVADLEFSLGVIAACIPTLIPLVKQARSNAAYGKMSGHFITNPSKKQGSSQRMTNGEIELHEIYPKSETRIECGSNVPATGVSDKQEIAIPFSTSWTVEYSPA